MYKNTQHKNIILVPNVVLPEECASSSSCNLYESGRTPASWHNRSWSWLYFLVDSKWISFAFMHRANSCCVFGSRVSIFTIVAVSVENVLLLLCLGGEGGRGGCPNCLSNCAEKRSNTVLDDDDEKVEHDDDDDGRAVATFSPCFCKYLSKSWK